MYPGSFDCEQREKEDRNQRPEHQEFRERIAAAVSAPAFPAWSAAAATLHRCLHSVHKRRSAITVHGISASRTTDECSTRRAAGADTGSVAKRSRLCSRKNSLKKVGFWCCTAINHGSTIAKYSSTPGHQNDRRTIDHSLRSRRKRRHDQNRQKRRHRPLGQRRYTCKEIDIEEPELRVRLVPRIPAQQPDAQRRRQSAYPSTPRAKSR